MSGAVEVLREPDGGYVVACFRSDCPEHSMSAPWVEEASLKYEADRIARTHRAWIKNYYLSGRCGECGQKVPAINEGETNHE